MSGNGFELRSPGYSRASTLTPVRAIGRARGQVAVEFIFVLIFMLVVVASIIVPLGNRLQGALEDVSTAGSVSTGLKRVSGAIEIALITNGDTSQYVDVFLPKGTKLSCSPATGDINISFPVHAPDYNLDGSQLAPCRYFFGADPAMVCTKVFRIPGNVSRFHCQGTTNPFSVEAGAIGFSQRFRVDANYRPVPGFATTHEIGFTIG